MSANVSGPLCTVMNDFCLLKIFTLLELRDLLNLADVNHQFKRVSEMVFGGRYATFKYAGNEGPHGVSRSVMRRVLCKFGKLIKTLQYWTGYDQSTELDEIPQFCAGGTLNELQLKTRLMIKDDDCARLLFSSLKTLSLSYSEFNGDAGALFSECHELKTLKLYDIPHCESISDVAQKYPKLEELLIDNVNDQTTTALLQLNQQIKKLIIGSCTSDNIAKLASLKSLRVLELHYVAPQLIPVIFEAMENVHSLERFKWYCDFHFLEWQFTHRVNKLKTLKSLALSFPFLPLTGWFGELGGQFPLLHELEVDFSDSSLDAASSIDSLVRFIELSTTLEVLIIHTLIPYAYNQQFYDTLLKVIQRRQSSKTFKVTVYCFLSVMALNMHSNLLHVEFNTSA